MAVYHCAAKQFNNKKLQLINSLVKQEGDDLKMGLAYSGTYKDKRAAQAERFIIGYFAGEVVWLILWTGTILALELTEQIGNACAKMFT